ncbi:hypothetical protein EV715DRAFT_298282, partial [Schizophyllum commune]
EVEEIFEQGHVFTAWKIHRGVGKKTVHEVVQKSQALEAQLEHRESASDNEKA